MTELCFGGEIASLSSIEQDEEEDEFGSSKKVIGVCCLETVPAQSTLLKAVSMPEDLLLLLEYRPGGVSHIALRAVMVFVWC